MSTESLQRGSPHYVYPFDDMEQVFRRIDERISAIERAMVSLDRDLAVSEEKRKFVDQRFNQIDVRLARIDGHVSRLVWLIIAAIVGGFMSFLMRGGLPGV
ncbi:MAG: hypothetical protein WBB25_08935 [Sulfitobacter sp.]